MELPRRHAASLEGHWQPARTKRVKFKFEWTLRPRSTTRPEPFFLESIFIATAIEQPRALTVPTGPNSDTLARSYTLTLQAGYDP